MLLGSEVLEVGVGLAFVYLLLAILVSTINELIARILKLRHTTLQSGIGTLLADPNLASIGKELYAHPLIKALEKKGRPSYIHGRTFAAALLDSIAQGKATVTEVRAGVAKAVQEGKIPQDLERQLNIIINDANDDYAQLRAGVEIWFDDSMERVSGWYKRKAQVVTFFVSLGVVLFLNADTLALANGMLQNPAVRQAIVAQASTVSTSGDGTGVPVISIPDIKTNLAPLGFELGYPKEFFDSPLPWLGDGAHWMGRIPGWFVTVIAMLMGAPFWFDALSRLTNLRATGTPPKSKSDEAT